MKRFWISLTICFGFGIAIPLFAQTTPNATVTQVLTVPAKVPAKQALVSSANPANVGASITYTDTVTGASTTPTGTVSFYNGTTLIPTTGTATLVNGVASCVFSTTGMATGSYNITAVYSGDSVYAGGTKP